jgi:signal transduction histidine kinase
MHLQEHALRHISSEIHDNISLSLTLSKVYLQDLDYSHPHQLKKRIDVSIGLIKKAISDLNYLSKSLNPDLVERFGLITSIEQLVNDIESAGLLSIELNIQGVATFLPSNDELILFRIVQEALRNIIKHAKATHVTIHVCSDESLLTINITDNGCGFIKSNEHPTGSGIGNMTRRARLLNASIIINPQTTGTAITISVPKKTNAPSHEQRKHCY